MPKVPERPQSYGELMERQGNGPKRRMFEIRGTRNFPEVEILPSTSDKHGPIKVTRPAKEPIDGAV